MAKAGFIHTPSQEALDTVTCLTCGLTLQGWEEGDSPFEEHAARRPKCPYFKQCPQGFWETQDLAQWAALDSSQDKKSPLDGNNSEQQPKKNDVSPCSQVRQEVFQWDAITEPEKDSSVLDFIQQRHSQAKAHFETEARKLVTLWDQVCSKVL